MADISHGIERIPIPCDQNRDVAILPRDFEYVRDVVGATELPLLEDAHGCHAGCECEGNGARCPCQHISGLELSRDGAVAASWMRFECGPGCACDSVKCSKRPSQNGVAVSCKLAYTAKHKSTMIQEEELRWRRLDGFVSVQGWGVFAAANIAPGAFVCPYAGEVITSAEASQRLVTYDKQSGTHGHALLVVREVLPSLGAAVRLNIDATTKGNVARFINHSCDGGNLEPVVVRCCGTLLPRVGLFARRQIVAGEELTFSYGQRNGNAEEDFGGNGAALRKSTSCCLCGTPACLGYLPSEQI